MNRLLFRKLKDIPVLILFGLFFYAVNMNSLAGSLEGSIDLTDQKISEQQPFVRSITGDLAANTKWYVGQFFGQQVIFAGLDIKNVTKKKYSYDYYVAFLDEKGKLVGTASQGSKFALEPGESVFLGSCIVRIPKEKMQSIKAFMVTFYESAVN